MDNKNEMNGLLLKSKIKVILAIVGIIICVVVICGMSIAVYKEYDSYISLKNDTKNIVKYKSGQLYYLDFGNNYKINYDNYKSFLNDISNIGEVDISGTFDKSMASYKELKTDNEYKKVHRKITEDNSFTNMSSPENTDIIRMSSGIYKLSKIELESGEDYSQYNGDEIPILVGYNYKDVIKVGQTLTEEYDKKTYKIIGIMKKNSKWIKNGNLGNVSNHVASYINLDNFFVAIYNYDKLINNRIVQIGFDSTYICLKNKDDKDILDKVNKLGEKYELDFNLVNIKEIYEKIEESTSHNMTQSVSIGCVIFSISMLGIILLILWIRKIAKHKNLN